MEKKRKWGPQNYTRKNAVGGGVKKNDGVGKPFIGKTRKGRKLKTPKLKKQTGGEGTKKRMGPSRRTLAWEVAG